MNLLSLIFNKASRTKTRFKSGRLEDVYPDIYSQTLCLQHLGWRYGHLGHDETLIQIVALSAHLKVRQVFEFGTFDGRTTVNIALNLEAASTVYSLDFHDEALRGSFQDKEAAYMKPEMTRALFRERKINPEILRKISLLFGNSREYDFKPYVGKMDLVLVDGGHDRETVISDSYNALKMIRPGGVIIWDDYSQYWPDVFCVLNQLAEILPMFRDKRTGLMFYFSDNKILIDPDKILAGLLKK